MIDLNQLKIDARGRWPGIFQHLGIDVGEGKHKACPHCGGKDRFRFDDKDGNGSYYCNQCGSGDGLGLVKKTLGLTFPEVIKSVAGIVGSVDANYKPDPKTDPKIALNKVWNSSTELTGSDQVSKYFHSRNISLTPDNIRFCPECYESETKNNMPAMVARIQNPDGKPISIHRTYLMGTGKADIKSPKKLMSGTEKLNGSAIRLFQPGGMFDADVIGVGEGIETSIACTQLFQVATWACVTSSVLESFQPPDGIRKIIIYGDNDKNFVGQKAAHTLAQKLFNIDYLVDVEIPDQYGDWADVLKREARSV